MNFNKMNSFFDALDTMEDITCIAKCVQRKLALLEIA